jgi:hypothetical protein
MTELYVFRRTTGHAEMVTDNKSGKKLLPHSFGQWVFSRTINVAGETHLMGGSNCVHHWPELEPDFPPFRSPTPDFRDIARARAEHAGPFNFTVGCWLN